MSTVRKKKLLVALGITSSKKLANPRASRHRTEQRASLLRSRISVGSGRQERSGLVLQEVQGEAVTDAKQRFLKLRQLGKGAE